LKPGGYLLSFAGTRTYDWIVMGVRLAGFEIRDMVGWIYGSGFPKSLDVSKAIDGMMGAEREVVGESPFASRKVNGSEGVVSVGITGSGPSITAPATEAARQWSGYGTALKPAIEPVVMARKPLEGTVAANVLKWGTGGLNVDGCRVGTEEVSTTGRTPSNESGRTIGGAWSGHVDTSPRAGRWPANIIHDGSDEVLAVFPVTTSGGTPVTMERKDSSVPFQTGRVPFAAFSDSGSASRFFKSAQDAPDLLLCDAKAIIATCERPASIVRKSTTHRSLCGDFVQSLVQAAGRCGALLQGISWEEHFTSETQSEFETLLECAITAILSIAQRSWLVSQPQRLILTGSLASIAGTNAQTGTTTITASLLRSDGYAESVTLLITGTCLEAGDPASVSRFKYSAKASRAEREHGLDALPHGIVDPSREPDSAGRDNPRAGAGRSGEGRANIHPTVKPVDLMRYLTRLVTPPGGLVVDPYAGSGTTGVAAIHEGFRFMGAEQDTAHALIAVTRIEQAVADEREARTIATMQITLF
jgi:hypothetical protein